MNDSDRDVISPIRFFVVVSSAFLLLLSDAGCGTHEDSLCASGGRTGVARGKMSERNVRTLAIESPKPQYPVVSIDSGTGGIAVSEVFIDGDGNTEEVCVLQAPDAHIREAVKHALMRWIFQSVTREGRSEGIPMSSKVSFYFVLKNGDSLVLSPEEMRADLDLQEPSATGASNGSRVNRSVAGR